MTYTTKYNRPYRLKYTVEQYIAVIANLTADLHAPNAICTCTPGALCNMYVTYNAQLVVSCIVVGADFSV